jgi:hypothetical protein
MSIKDYDQTKKGIMTASSGSPTIQKAFPIILVDGDDSTTGTGDFVLDFSNINSVEDIAVYDQNDNLLDYDIESLDTTAGTGVLWVYNSWVRDGSTQVKIAYGDNNANTDRQNTSETWNNAAQNTQFLTHYNAASGSLVDRSPNGNDSTSESITQYQAPGQFDGSAEFDGSNFADHPTNGLPTGDFSFTMKVWFKITSSVDQWFYQIGNEATDEMVGIIQNSAGPGIRFFSFASTNLDSQNFDSDDGEWHQAVGTYNNSTGDWILYLDGSQNASATENGLNVQYGGQFIGRRGQDNSRYTDGFLDETGLWLGEKSSDWVEADWEASPKAGQTLFSQQAAQTTTPTATAQTTTAIATPRTAKTTPQIGATTTIAQATPLQASTITFARGFSWESEQTMGLSLKSNTKPAQRETFYRQGQTTDDDYFSLSTDTNGYVNVKLVDNGATINDFAVPVDILDGDWHRVLIRMTSSEDLEVFIDGVKETTESSQFTTVNSHGSIVFEQNDLFVDEFKRWETDLNITEIGNDDANFPVADSDLFVWWSFDNPRLGERYTSKTTIK